MKHLRSFVSQKNFRNPRKILCWVLAGLFCCFSLLSCNRTKTPGQPDSVSGFQTDTVPDTPQAIPVPETALALTANGTSDFLIIRAANCTTEEKEQADALRMAFQKISGVRLKSVTDDSLAAQSSAGQEILIGKTNRTESTEIYRDLRARDWAACVKNGKIVLAGHSAYMLQAAVNAFCGSLIADGSQNIYTACNTVSHASYTFPEATLNGVVLSAYTIVYPENRATAFHIAKTVRDLLERQTGYMLSCLPDSIPGTEYEILVGHTNRAESAVFYGTAYSDSAVCVTTVGNKQILAFGSAQSAETAATKYYNKLLSLSSSGETELSALSASETGLPAPEGHVPFSILSFNIWNVWIAGHTPYNRDDLAASILLSYLPDVFGLQEYDAPFRYEEKGLAQLLGAEYTEVPTETVADDNWNPVFYRTDRFELLSSGHATFTQGTEYTYQNTARSHFRSYTYAVLKDLLSGETVIVYNTHFDTDTAHHALQSKELLESVATVHRQFGGTVFVIGDYNCRPDGIAVGALRGYGFADTHDLSPVQPETSGTHPYPTFNASKAAYDVYSGNFYSNRYSDAVDHCMVLGDNCTVRDYSVLTLEEALLTSDHCPICIRCYLQIKGE